MKKIAFLAAITFALLITSCSGDLEDRTASEFLSAYMKDNKNVVLFGKVDAKQILEKAEYKSIPKLSVLLKSEMKQYESALELNDGVCFAMEGPFDQNGNPAQLLAFVKVRNADSLASKVSSLGLPVQVSGDLEFVQENEVTIGIKENLAIVITKSGKYDGKAALAEAFKKAEQDVSEGKVDQILAEKGDILMGASFENLYASSNTSLNKLNAQKKQEFEALVKDSYLQATVSFEKGQAVMEMKNLFSNELMNRMFMKEDPSASILAKLGKGNARVGLAMNLDMNKMETFLEDFAPNYKQDLIDGDFSLQMAASVLGDKPFTNLLSGKLGFVMTGNPTADGSFVPETNIHIGLGKKGNEVKDMVLGFFPSDGVFGMKVQANAKEINVSSGNTSAAKLLIPGFANSFGKKGATAFVNFDGLDMKSFDLDEGGKFVYALQNILLTADNNGAKMIVKGKKANQNILKQIVDVYISDLEETIGNIN
ncbi:MAG: hypothetical protein ACK5B9_02220 [Flavobacteriia bacterium]|jgi:antitoxin component of MazEF toxin-antitoxin module